MPNDKRMSRKEREALRELCAKATPGPWRGARDEQDANQWWGKFPQNAPECVVLTDEEKVDGEEPWPICSTSDDGLATEQESANAHFIAAARTALPQLLDEHEELLRRVRELLNALDRSRHADLQEYGVINASRALREYVREDA